MNSAQSATWVHGVRAGGGVIGRAWQSFKRTYLAVGERNVQPGYVQADAEEEEQGRAEGRALDGGKDGRAGKEEDAPRRRRPGQLLQRLHENEAMQEEGEEGHTPEQRVELVPRFCRAPAITAAARRPPRCPLVGAATVLHQWRRIVTIGAAAAAFEPNEGLKTD